MMLLVAETDHDELGRIASLSGLEADLLRGTGITRWLHRRARTLGLDPKSHRAMLMESEEERRILSEQVAVPESWIGRYPVSFDLLRERAKAAKSRSSIFRILSLGCAAGQEPFTAAACILDAGVAAARIDVVAVDRSRSSIEMGMNGNLPSMAVRGELPVCMQNRVERSGHGWKVSDEIRSLVRFVEADVVSELLPVDPESCDVVFCRNVLIYLESDARDRLCRRATSYLVEDGILLAGHADPPRDLNRTLSSVDRPGAFAWRRRSDAPTQTLIESPLPAADRSGGPAWSRRSDGPKRSRIERPAPTADGPAANRVPRQPTTGGMASDVTPVASLASSADVEAIRKLADLGKLLEARELAEGLLVNHPADPSVILILATIESADGRVEAARDHLRRVLYLNPDDLSALFQMAVLCESEGELDVADRFRRRMDRLASDGGFEK